MGVVLLLLTWAVIASLLAMIFLVLYLEGRRDPFAVTLRRWRVAWSKRSSVQQHAQLANQAHTAKRRAEEQAIGADALRKQAEAKAAERVDVMGAYIISEQVADQLQRVTASNYHAREKRILQSVTKAAQNGYTMPEKDRKFVVRRLNEEHRLAINAEAERQRQAEVKAQIREEERREREIRKAIKKADQEAKFKREALEKAIKMLGGQHSEEIDQLRHELAEAQAAAERTKSLAEQTKVGHIYVISNIGSFGEHVFKVGMTRRLEPMDRVRELGDASVPFSFDVHAIFASDDAPATEAALHRELDEYRVNRVNLRKEFFCVPLDKIVEAVKLHHGNVNYTADAEALEYLESKAMQEELADTEDLMLTAALQGGAGEVHP
jgi:hypothetical protein